MTDLAELFARDPLTLTKENIDEVIEYFRGARVRYLEGEKSAGSPKKMKAEAKPKAKGSMPAIDVGELEL